MKLSNVLEQLKEKYVWGSGELEDRFWYFFWDLVHYYKGITNRYTTPGYDPNPEEITECLDDSIKSFSRKLLDINSNISHPIHLNNVNRYGWEWIMQRSKYLINLKYSEKTEEIEDKLKKHEKALMGVFKDPTRIGYKGLLR